MATEREQKLVDILFACVMMCREYKDSSFMETQEALAEWTAKQLEGCGFPTYPAGCSWGVLKD
jgi:uncharacterized protein YgfB (UPF0149 family)